MKKALILSVLALSMASSANADYYTANASNGVVTVTLDSFPDLMKEATSNCIPQAADLKHKYGSGITFYLGSEPSSVRSGAYTYDESNNKLSLSFRPHASAQASPLEAYFGGPKEDVAMKCSVKYVHEDKEVTRHFHLKTGRLAPSPDEGLTNTDWWGSWEMAAQ